MEEISKKWDLPIKDCSCPGCGREYGHHNTKVDPISEECSTCAKERGVDKSYFVTAEEFISKLKL
jgi:hypothetical protein